MGVFSVPIRPSKQIRYMLANVISHLMLSPMQKFTLSKKKQNGNRDLKIDKTKELLESLTQRQQPPKLAYWVLRRAPKVVL